jgi:catechol 2,3-dioxygenase-like lactoylglutathione lyase family enzyme
MPAYVSSTVARPMPNIDNLKKQAKMYLRWHRNRYYPVAARIRAVLPRYPHLSDQEVLAHSFTLSDAQELIARKAGFESWEALRRGNLAMTDAQEHTVGKSTLSGAEPQLIVSDIAASIEFFTKKLGFTVAFSSGEPPFYAQVFRDGARLNLRYLDTPGLDPALRDREQVLSASITLADAKPLFLEYQAAGVVFAQPLRTEPWGARTFIVRDPDGNLILFAGHAE